MLIDVKKYALLFLLGAIGYAAIEIIWRGRTHWSMMIAGGVCFILFSLVAKYFQGQNIIIQAVLCAALVTLVEFVFGIIFNIWLNMGVWDYSNMPFNIMGQICPTFSIMWVGVAMAFLPLARIINLSFS